MAAMILIVEDDSTFRSLLKELVCAFGYAVTEADCLAALRSHFSGPAPEVLLLDLQLPDGHGLSALPEVKRHWPSTRVVIVTGHGSVETAEKAYKLDDVFLLNKPLDAEMLKTVLELALALRKPAAPKQEPSSGETGIRGLTA